MIEKDTVRLLRECDAGVKMGISSIGDVIEYVCAKELGEKLEKCKERCCLSRTTSGSC